MERPYNSCTVRGHTSMGGPFLMGYAHEVTFLLPFQHVLCVPRDPQRHGKFRQTCIQLGRKSSWILGEGPVTLPALSFCEGVHQPSCEDVSQPSPGCTQRIAMHGREHSKATEPRLASPSVLCHSFRPTCILGLTRIAIGS